MSTPPPLDLARKIFFFTANHKADNPGSARRPQDVVDPGGAPNRRVGRARRDLQRAAAFLAFTGSTTWCLMHRERIMSHPSPAGTFGGHPVVFAVPVWRNADRSVPLVAGSVRRGRNCWAPTSVPGRRRGVQHRGHLRSAGHRSLAAGCASHRHGVTPSRPAGSWCCGSTPGQAAGGRRATGRHGTRRARGFRSHTCCGCRARDRPRGRCQGSVTPRG